MGDNNNEILEHMVSDERRLIQIEQDVTSLKKEVAEIKTSISDLVTAWRTANGVVAFVKWLASIAAAITALVVFLKLGGKV